MGRRLLIVEDELAIRQILTEYLLDSGFDVAVAEDGDHAVGWLDQHDELDLLITDIEMPGGTDGIGVALRARALHPGLPVIYASGCTERLGNPIGEHDAVVPKPFGPAIIAATVQRLLGMIPANA